MSLLIEDLCKKYELSIKKSKYIVNGLNFTVNEGEIYSLIGQNGAGKTTTIKCILKLIKKDKGRVLVDDMDIDYLMKDSRVGYLPENLTYPSIVSLEEFLFDLCVLKGMGKQIAQQRIEELTLQFGLADSRKKSISKFSKGMKRKAGFIQAIINQPKILILDEPTDGLDPVSRKLVLNSIREFADRGNMVLITSHILSDLNLISDKVGLIDGGRIISEINIKEFKKDNISKIIFETTRNSDTKDEIYTLAPMIEINVEGLEKCRIKDIALGNPDLEDWYFNELLNKEADTCGR